MQDIKKFRERIMQCPVIEGMTKEQLDAFYKRVHEEKHGNTSNVWDIVPGSGTSYQVEAKPMSDDLCYGDFDCQERKREEEEREFLATRHTYKDKLKEIEDNEKYIERQKNRIEELKKDTTFTVLEKQQKIQKCIDIINQYTKHVSNLKDYLAIQAAKDRELAERYGSKTK